MAVWTLLGLIEGKATTRWPKAGGDSGQDGVQGMPRFDSALCGKDCAACVAVCPTGALTLTADHDGRHLDGSHLDVDYGRCIACQLCVETCPDGAASLSQDWAFGVGERADLVLSGRTQAAAESHQPQAGPDPAARSRFRRSLHIRHVDAGSCNGCESELQALNNPFYNLHRLGIFFTASPRFADLLLVTGPVTYAMREPLLRAYEAMPDPKWVMAMGSCAITGALSGGGYTGGNGLEDILPVDLYLPGSPPNPAAIIEALLMFLGRAPQRLKGGHLA